MKRIAVIGLGYVGLPLAAAFGEKREVVGFDINPKRIWIVSCNEEDDDSQRPWSGYESPVSLTGKTSWGAAKRW